MLKSLYLSDQPDDVAPTPPPSAGTRSMTGSYATRILHQEYLIQDESPSSHILITDDNALNRKVSSIYCLQDESVLTHTAPRRLHAQTRPQLPRSHQRPRSRASLQRAQAELRNRANGYVSPFFLLFPNKLPINTIPDMSMPVMDGMSATRAIRQFERDHAMPRCSIIALTGLTSASARLEAWSSGIDHFMTKPVNFKMLGELLRKEEMKRMEKAKEGRQDEGTIREVSELEVENEVGGEV